MLSKRQRLKWWLREARLPKPRRRAARAERWNEMAHHIDDRADRISDRATSEAEGHHSRAADFHRG
jgi:hypothetical protein